MIAKVKDLSTLCWFDESFALRESVGRIVEMWVGLDTIRQYVVSLTVLLKDAC
jgi:hypothetical protein